MWAGWDAAEGWSVLFEIVDWGFVEASKNIEVAMVKAKEHKHGTQVLLEAMDCLNVYFLIEL